mmetsp:Transcript_10442/g.14774  ORF Transcript_10442/g.14774 Transcript_10442/m.14774 type:complete len:365 (+) Transcript_10442:198-1292(+)
MRWTMTVLTILLSSSRMGGGRGSLVEAFSRSGRRAFRSTAVREQTTFSTEQTWRRTNSASSSASWNVLRQVHGGTAAPGNNKPLMMVAVDEDEQTDSAKTLESTWNIPGLKKEVQRLILRSHKKVGKATTRLNQARETVESLMEDENATDEQLDACPNVDALELELEELRQRLGGLNDMEESLASIKGKSAVLPEELAKLALDLGVNDAPPARPVRGPKKKKGPSGKEASRLPYRRYFTINKTEIRVGKQAEDNDQLSLSPQHRDGSDWWMHASGCPGSHIVIRCSDQTLDENVVMDAAALAARQSKCNGATIKVSLTRCRNISKPAGAKAGLVQLSGDVQTVVVKMKEAESRLARLDETVLIN